MKRNHNLSFDDKFSDYIKNYILKHHFGQKDNISFRAIEK